MSRALFHGLAGSSLLMQALTQQQSLMSPGHRLPREDNVVAIDVDLSDLEERAMAHLFGGQPVLADLFGNVEQPAARSLAEELGFTDREIQFGMEAERLAEEKRRRKAAQRLRSKK